MVETAAPSLDLRLLSKRKGDWTPEASNRARLKPPLAECLDRGVIQQLATRAFFHFRGRDPTSVSIDFHQDYAAAGWVASSLVGGVSWSNYADRNCFRDSFCLSRSQWHG